jgi:hypothetical protein
LNNEDNANTIFYFIQLSVNFWNKVILPPQNEETKYSIEILSEGAVYCLNIINQQSHGQNISLKISNCIVFDLSINHQNEFPEEQSQIAP